MTNYTKAYLKLSESEIYFEVIGNGPPLLFAHGLGGNHLSWWNQIPYFSKRFKCITFSHRGFSLSKNYSDKIEVSKFGDDLESLINHLDIDNVNIVAQSMGGWTALNYALRKSSKVRSLVMASTTGELNFKLIDHPEIHNLKEWETESEKLKSELSSLGLLASTGARMAAEQPSLNYLYSQIYDLTSNNYKDKVRSIIRNSRSLSPDEFKKLKIPLLFITGNEDLLFPPGAANAAASLLPNAGVKCIPSTGHSLYFERPDIFNSLINEFLSSVINI